MEISSECRQEEEAGWSPAWACGLDELDGPKQMPGFLEQLFSGTGQRQISATQGLGLEPVHKTAECVQGTWELASFEAKLSHLSLSPRVLWFLS